MERETGIGPATNSLEGCDSTIELLPLFLFSTYRVLMDTIRANMPQRRPFAQNLHKDSAILPKCTKFVVHLAIASFDDIVLTYTNRRLAQSEEALSLK
jgi:hypothetical protein